jgi:hypothetical protein
MSPYRIEPEGRLMTDESKTLDELKTIQKSIDANTAQMAALLKVVTRMKTSWEFDVERDPSGTIKKVTAKPD